MPYTLAGMTQGHRKDRAELLPAQPQTVGEALFDRVAQQGGGAKYAVCKLPVGQGDEERQHTAQVQRQ